MGKRYLYLMSFPCERYATTIFNPDPKLSTLIAERENSHNFYPESLGDFLHYRMALVSLILCRFQTSCESLKSTIFGCKMGEVPTNFVAKIIVIDKGLLIHMGLRH